MGASGIEPLRRCFTDTIRTLPILPCCTPYRDRTCDLLYVRQPLLPSELRVLIVSPTGFEPVTPSLKVRCSKTNWATKTLSKWEGSNLRPDGPKPPALPTELHLVKTNTLTPFGLWRTRIIHSVLVRGRSRCRSQYPSRYRPFSRRGHRPLWFIFLIIVVPQGFEPQFHGPKPCVLPIRRGNNNETNMSKNFFFWGLYQVRTDDSGLQSRDITNYTKRPI